MADNGNPAVPALMHGALVQLTEDLGVIVPLVIPFQYNPAKVTRGFEPWNPFATDPQNQAAQTPLVQPFDPQETYGFELELDSTDDLAAGHPVATTVGIAPRIAALRKLIEPTEGVVGDLVASVTAIAGGGARQADRPAVPITLFVLGPGTIVPVRVTALSIDVTAFLPSLYPHMAKVTLALQVLTPDVFKCKKGTATNVAVAAYKFTKLQEDALAVTAAAGGAAAIVSMLPI
jgi:hypothetical protein